MPGPGFKAHPENINRKGRPKKGDTWAETYRKIGDEAKVLEESGDIRSRREIVAGRVYEKAETGDVGAAKEITDREEGRAVQRVQEYNEVSEQWAEALRLIFGDNSSAGKSNKTKQKTN